MTLLFRRNPTSRSHAKDLRRRGARLWPKDWLAPQLVRRCLFDLYGLALRSHHPCSWQS